MANVCAECAGRLFKYDAQLRRGRWRHLLRLKIRHEHCKCFSEVFLLFKKVVEAAGVELLRPIDNTQAVDSISRLNRENRQNCQSEVHARYTAHLGRFPFGAQMTQEERTVTGRLEFVGGVIARLALERYSTDWPKAEREFKRLFRDQFGRERRA